MITFLGRHITENMKLGPFLANIYGLGPRSGFKLCNFFGLGYNQNISNVDSEKLFFIQQYLSSYTLESNLRRYVNDNIQNKLKMQSYSGLRLSQGLPSRGQRTKTNSQTCKKFRKKLILQPVVC
jgi:small subunit ribosomal protein S13